MVKNYYVEHESELEHTELPPQYYIILDNLKVVNLKMIRNDIELTICLRTSRGTEEDTTQNPQSVNSSMKIYVSYIFLKLIIYIYFSVS